MTISDEASDVSRQNLPGSSDSSRDVNSRREPFLGQPGGVVNLNGTSVDPDSVEIPAPVFLGANPERGGYDREAIEKFITTLCGDAPGLMQTVRKDSKGMAPRFHTTDTLGIGEAVKRLANLSAAPAENSHLYIQVSTCITNPNDTSQEKFGDFGYKRGGKANVSHLLCLWNDIDYGDDGHAEGKNGRLPHPPDAATAHAIYRNSGLPEASVIVNSGGGLYEIVLLETPLDVRDPAVRDRVESVTKRWQQLIEKTAREMGYHYGAGVGNTERLLRVPGTVNTKVWDNKRRATALYGDDARYCFADLEALINDLHPEPPPPVRPDGGQIGMERWSWSGDEDDLPGTDFNARGDWQRDILDPAGITYAHAAGNVTYWCRPGKSPRDGHGFSLDHKPDLLFSFTDGTALPQWKFFDKFSAFAHLFHGGDFKKASAQLRTMGYGNDPSLFTQKQDDTWDEQPTPDADAADEMDTPTIVQPEAETEWIDPIPLEEEQPPAYDLSKLGELGAYAQHTAEAISVPYGMSLMTHLGAVSAAVGGRRRVNVRPEWDEAVVLHTLALAPPGSKKSPAQKKATAPLRAQEKLRQEADKTDVAVDAMKREILEDRIKEARKRAVMGKTKTDRDNAEGDIMDLVSQQIHMGPPKQHTRLVASDVTPEELANLMDRQGGRMAVLDSEATFLSVISGRYSQGGKPKLELTLSAYDHQSATVDRVSKDEPVILENPSLTISLAVQGDAITGLGKSTAEMDKKGAWGRFLYDVSSGRTLRTRYTPKIPKEVEAAHELRIQELMKTCYDDTEIKDMSLSDEAADIFFVHYEKSDPAYRADHHRVRIQGWDEKQPGRIIRIAALRTLYENPHALEIPGHIMRDVVALDETMTAHAHKASGFMQLSDRDPLEPARDVLDWLQGEMFTRPVKASEVQAAMRRKRRPWCNRLDDVLDALQALSEYHYLGFRVRPDGSRDTRLFKVHPLLAGEAAEEPLPPEESAEGTAEAPVSSPAPAPTAEDKAEEESIEETQMRQSALVFGLFLLEFCETGPRNTHWITAQELLDAFVSYAGDDGWLNPVRLGKIIRRILPDAERSKKRIDGKHTSIYKGVQIIPMS